MPGIPIGQFDFESEGIEEERGWKARPPTRAERRWMGPDTRARYHEFVLREKRTVKLVKEGFSRREVEFYKRRRIGQWKMARLRKRRAEFMKTVSPAQRERMMEQMSEYFESKAYEDTKVEPWSPPAEKLEELVEVWTQAKMGWLYESR